MQSELESLKVLMDEANLCLVLLSNQRHSCDRMDVDIDDFDYSEGQVTFRNDSIAARHDGALQEFNATSDELSGPLKRLFEWGTQHGIDTPSFESEFASKMPRSWKVDDCELAVRNIQSELATQLARLSLQAHTPHAGTPETPSSGFYIYMSSPNGCVCNSSSALYLCDDKDIAIAICRLCKRSFVPEGDDTGFYIKPVDEVSPDDQLLIEEKLDDLRLYDDPDPGLYEHRVSNETLMQAQYAIQAAKWERRMKDRRIQSRTEGLQPPQSTAGATGRPANYDKALAGLQRAVEKHRLMFLFFAVGKRKSASGWDTVDRDARPDQRIPSEEMDADGEFLFRYQWAIDQYWQDCASQFGPDVGARESTFDGDKWVVVAGSALPVWSIDEIGCGHLEDSSNAILDACKTVVRADVERRLHALVVRARDLVHDEGQSRWCSSMLVRWSYVSRLDDLIKAVKTAGIDYTDHQPDHALAASRTPPPSQEGRTTDAVTAPSINNAPVALSTTVERHATGESHYDSEEAKPPNLPFKIVESAFQVIMHGRTYTFPVRSRRLFALLVRITQRPGHRVQFDTLRQKNNVWDGYDVEDSTIRGAVMRLKNQLRVAKMAQLAQAISTGTFDNRQYVILNPAALSKKSN